MTPLTKEELRSLIGEGFHTMLRKGIDGHGSAELWKYINDMPEGEWRGMLDHWIVTPLMREIQRRGRAIRQKPPSSESRLRMLVLRYIKVRHFEVLWTGEVNRLDHEWRQHTPREREDPMLQHIVHPILMACRHAARKMRQARRLEKELLTAVTVASGEAPLDRYRV